MKLVADPIPVPAGTDPLRLNCSPSDPNAQPPIFCSFSTDSILKIPARDVLPYGNGETISLVSGHRIARKPVILRGPTVNYKSINIADLVVQDYGNSHEHLPMPVNVNPEPLPVLADTEFRDSETDETENESWEEIEIPEELGYIQDGEPEEIRNIIQESLDEHRALRASKMHTQAIVVRTTITMSRSDSEGGTVRPSVETTATACTRSSDHQHFLELIQTPNRPPSRDRSSPDSMGLDSSASVGSSNGDVPLNNLRTSSELYAPTSSQESLSSSTKSSSAKLPKPSVKPTRNHALFRHLGRRAKALRSNDQSSTVTGISECTSCFDDVPFKKAVDLPCRHQYCQPCFSQLVSTAIQSEDTFPPKCCIQEIPRRTLDSHLSPKAMSEYDEKALEYAVAVSSRYYCGSPDCAKWIDTRKAQRSNGALQCPRCQFWTCTSCRGAQHGANQDCPQDYDLGAALQQAERAGWRRCYSCRTMVELNTGCRHITCKCKAEFCYTCGARWRTCSCTEADQARREIEVAERLARYNAVLQAEEAEVREAIAEVERAERQVAAEREAEERELEEARQAEEEEEFQRREDERLEGINRYFMQLRAVLERVLLQQKQAIASRHEQELPKLERMEEDLLDLNISRRRDRQATLERASIAAVNDEKITELRRQHRAILLTTLKRHTDDQDAVFLQPIRGPEIQRGRITSRVLDILMAAQDAERRTLEAQQERELRKWRRRGALALQEFDSIMMEEKLRFGKIQATRMDEVRRALTQARQQSHADWKWLETLEKVRIIMIEEDQTRMIRLGADAPVLELPVD